MAVRRTHRLADATVHTLFSDRADGDFDVERSAPERAAVRHALVDLPWTWLRQVHGARVVEVTEPGGASGEAADAAVTAVPGAVVAVQTADCAPVLLWGDTPRGAAVAAVHVGWRGLLAGVVAAAVDRLRARGVQRPCWDLGVCIGPAHYEFSPADLASLERRFGAVVRGTTAAGRPALDLPAAVGAAVSEAGVEGPPASGAPASTADTQRWWSHRVGGDAGRQTAAVWIAPRAERS